MPGHKIMERDIAETLQDDFKVVITQEDGTGKESVQLVRGKPHFVSPTKRLEMYGEDIEPSDDSNFIFTLIDDDTAYSIRRKDDSISGNIVIPYEHNGKPVIYIDEMAFNACVNISSVIIPNSIRSIDTEAFWGCDGLTSITIPKSVRDIGRGAFAHCASLTSVTIIPDEVSISPYGAFDNFSQNVTIYCNKGSSAEMYCKNYPHYFSGNIPYVTPVDSGDLYNYYTKSEADTLLNGKLDYKIGYEDKIDDYSNGNGESFCDLYKISDFSSEAEEFYDFVPYYLIASYNADMPYGGTRCRQIKIQNGYIFHRYYLVLPPNNSHWTDWSGSYTKPKTGIPESDLSADVQADLIKADDLEKRLQMYGKAVTPSNLRCSYVSQRDAYEMASVDTATTGDIVVPYQYDDGTHGLKPVYGAGRGVFQNCTEITSITFPKTITTFNGAFIFKGCSKLKSVTIPDSVTYFAGSAMFEGCTNLISVTLPDSITYFGNEIFNNRPANLVVLCNKGSNAESYCKANNVPYTYNDFKDKQDIDNRKFKLYYHFIAGYSVLTTEPSDWSTNYTSYYTLYGTSTSEDMAYVAVTGDVAPTFVPRQYYSKATGTTVDTPWFSFPKITGEAIILFSSAISQLTNSSVEFVGSEESDQEGGYRRIKVPMQNDGFMYVRVANGWLYGYGTGLSTAGLRGCPVGEFGTSTNRWNASNGCRTLKIDGHIRIYTPQEEE